jgi:hypothetical protein
LDDCWIATATASKEFAGTWVSVIGQILQGCAQGRLFSLQAAPMDAGVSLEGDHLANSIAASKPVETAVDLF